MRRILEVSTVKTGNTVLLSRNLGHQSDHKRNRNPRSDGILHFDGQGISEWNRKEF